jgi:hypothetical protein
MPDNEEGSVTSNIERISVDLIRAFQGEPSKPFRPLLPPKGTEKVPPGGAVGSNVPAVVVAEPKYYTVRVRLLGFYCATETWDHATQADGPRDEIVVKADVQQYDANKQQIEQNTFETPVYGFPFSTSGVRVIPRPNGIQAGTATSSGGIRTGDSVPDDIRVVASARNAFPNRLPLLLWEHNGVVGDRLDGHLLITPSLIEWDGDVDFLTKFGEDIGKFLKRLGDAAAAIGGAVALIFPPVGAKIAGAGLALRNAPGLIGELQKFLGEAGDRPIGQKLVEGKRTFDPQILSFNLAHIRDVADSDPLALGRGVWGVNYEDDSALGGGKYGVYVHVEHYVHPVLQ